MNIAAPKADGFYHIGQHRIRFEAPDIIFVQTNGTLHPEECDSFFQLVYGLFPDRPFYLLRDARNGGTHGAEARSRLVALADPTRIAGIAIYGASFSLRVFVTMLHKTVRVLKHAMPDVAFVETEPEARAWIDAQHRQKHGDSSD